MENERLYFICGLFNDAVSSLDCIALNDTVINELERMWKEAVMAQFKVLTWKLLERLWKTTVRIASLLAEI
jgi:hypothetical protein